MYGSYQIVEVSPHWRIAVEEMGSKEKFWYRDPETEIDRLFKFPQVNTGQHWAEKIAAEVAAHLGILHAKVELAVFRGTPGSVTKSFAGNGRELVHGNQLLERIVHGYDSERTFRQSAHTLSNIWHVMEGVFVQPDRAGRAKLRIATYLVLDALIGNTDRHHENWGLLRNRTGDQWRGFVAPSFDHASSLGRELLDHRRDRLLAENRVGDYVEKGRGAIYWSEEERHGLSPLELVRRAHGKYPNFFRPALVKIANLDENALFGVVNCVPSKLMTPSAREFAGALLCYNLGQLRGLIS